jgi:arylsulfatase
MFGNRALYHDGWIASCFHGRAPWSTGQAPGFETEETWELYNLASDFSQADDRAAREPKKLRELQDLWWAEAAKYNVLPLDDRMAERFDARLRPDPLGGRTTLTYGDGAVLILEPSAPSVMNKSYRITVDAEIPREGAEGTLVACGGSSAGYAFYVQDATLVWHYNYFGEEHFRVQSSERVPAGRVTLGYEFKASGGPPGSGGIGTLSITGDKVGELRQPRTVPVRYGTGTFNVGEQNGGPIVPGQRPPFTFTGRIHTVTFELEQAGAEQREQRRQAEFTAAMKAA